MAQNKPVPPKPILMVHMDIKGIDMRALESAFDNVFDTGMDEIEKELDKVWRDKVGIMLHSSKQEYLDNLKVSRVGDEIQFVVTGELPVAVENGSTAFDMREGLLAGRLSRIIPLNSKTGTPTFRNVSQKSTGWKHPGITARNISEEVLKEAEGIVNDAFWKAMARVSV